MSAEKRSEERSGTPLDSAASSASAAQLSLAKERSLDYSLRFPAASGRGEDPVVLLFGWAGARDRYLSKYTDIYYDEGCISLRYTLPTRITFRGNRGELDKVGDELYRLLDELGLIGHPLVFHIFSGNGCITFNALLRSVRGKSEEARVKSSVRGLILDSCPARATDWHRAKAFTEALFPDHSQPVKLAVFWLAYAGLRLLDIWRWVETRLLKRPGVLHYYDELLQNQLYLKTPQLYLYSSADDICSSESIEAFITTQRSRGATVEVGILANSGHCQHYRRYPVLYTQFVAHFLHRVLPLDR